MLERRGTAVTSRVRRLGRLYATLRACDEGVLFFPVYTLLMADSGLSTVQLTSLLVIWSAVAFALEVPSGAWADTYSRRRLLAFGALLRAVGFATWFLWPTYAGFAIGFVMWGVRSAISSGTKEALLRQLEERAQRRAWPSGGRAGTSTYFACVRPSCPLSSDRELSPHAVERGRRSRAGHTRSSTG